jgi:hypothetical protein
MFPKVQYITFLRAGQRSAAPVRLVRTAPVTVTFSDQSSGAVDSLHWDYGDGATSTTSALTHTHPYTQPGTYTVTLTVNGLGGTDTQTATIGVVSQTYTTTTRVITYTYDKLYRLTDADYSSGETFAYAYDPVGNPVLLRFEDFAPLFHFGDVAATCAPRACRRCNVFP